MPVDTLYTDNQTPGALVPSIDPKLVLRKWGGTVPLYAMLNALKKTTVDNPRFSWFEKAHQVQRHTLGAGLNNTAGAADLTLTAGALSLRAGMILMVEHTQELLRINTTPTVDTTVNVTRGFAGTTVTTVTLGTAVNPNLLVVGSAFAENSTAPAPLSFEEEELFNYTQIFRNTYAMSNTAQATQLYYEKEPIKKSRQECYDLHLQSIERSIWFGERSQVASSGSSGPIRSTRGIDFSIPAGNKLVADDTFTYGEFENMLAQIFRRGSETKVLFTGNRGLLTLGQAARLASEYKIDVSNVTKYGIAFKEFITPFGTLLCKTHPQFKMVPNGASNTTWNSLDSTAYVLDMDNIELAVLKGRDTMHQENMQTPGQDGKLNGYISELGVKVKDPETHFKISNLRTAAA